LADAQRPIFAIFGRNQVDRDDLPSVMT
jgi:hypothetical protein